MKLKPYDDVPLFLSIEGSNTGEYIFAESASLTLSQDIKASRQLDDNILQICAFGDGSNMNFDDMFVFEEGSNELVVMGPIGGPPRPISSSINKIKKDSKITFPNGKNLFFSEEVNPGGHDFLTKVYAKSGGWSLTEEEAQNGYFEPSFKYVADSPIKGTLDVDFYVNEGNLPHFFSITGLVDPTEFPPINNDRVTGFLGDFAFYGAYLTQFEFSISPNSISQAKASFDIYGNLTKDESLSLNYYSSDLYQQQSIPHGETSKLVGLSSIGFNYGLGFSYSASISRYPKYEVPTGDYVPEIGFLPTRASKRQTNVSVTVEGDNLDPSVLHKVMNQENVEVVCELRDLSYDNYRNNSAGLLSSFHCNGAVQSESLSVNSKGYLNGSVTISQVLQ